MVRVQELNQKHGKTHRQMSKIPSIHFNSKSNIPFTIFVVNSKISLNVNDNCYYKIYIMQKIAN